MQYQLTCISSRYCLLVLYGRIGNADLGGMDDIISSSIPACPTVFTLIKQCWRTQAELNPPPPSRQEMNVSSYFSVKSGQ